jgi:hypothetical protein
VSPELRQRVDCLFDEILISSMKSQPWNSLDPT